MKRLEDLARIVVKTSPDSPEHLAAEEEMSLWLDKLDAERKTYAAEIEDASSQVDEDIVSVDDKPYLSVGEGGLWVSAWIWMPVDEEDDEGDEDENPMPLLNCTACNAKLAQDQTGLCDGCQ